MHICPRCETTLSQSEVAEGYRNIKDVSVTVKFELADEPGTYILAWTTTPWTLPGNVALAIGENIDYVKVLALEGNLIGQDFKDRDISKLKTPYLKPAYYILAKERINEVFPGKDPKIIEEFKGKKLINKRYRPLFPYYENKEMMNKENLYTIVGADFVSTEDGTGVVHIAPAYGEEDMLLGQEKKLPMIQNVGLDGHFYVEVKDFAGLSVKPIEDAKKTDKLIIEYLNKKNLLFSEEEFEHSYPHCWRCDTPLINYATSSWFVKILAIKEKAIKLAQQINWSPAHIKEGRFGKWLEGARDWSISRQRFWASVIPVWKCECGEIMVFGSIKELEEASGEKITDLHKHIIDKVEVPCKKCGKSAKRIGDVLDTWFDSGSMSFAQVHYPFENKEWFDKNFPAQFIAEGIDQTRAWFYYMHVIATAIKENIAFRNVIVNGIVLAEDGKKMSKHLNNYTDPTETMNKYGADALRFYLLSSAVMAAENLNFSDDGVKEMAQKVAMLLNNILNFYRPYQKEKTPNDFKSRNSLDIWIVSRLHSLAKEVSNAMENYDLPKATRPFIQFINEFSTWWLKLSRNRFKSHDKEENNEAIVTINYCLNFLSKLIAPFAPFIADHVYQEVNASKESVHLENWPFKEGLIIDDVILKRMGLTQKAVEIGLALRASANLKVRQPLSRISFKDKEMFDNIFVDLVKQELNVKEVVFNSEDKLDTEISQGLKEEGMFRELTRQINQSRKEANLSVNDKDVVLEYETESAVLSAVIQKFKTGLQEGCSCLELKKVSGSDVKELNVDGEKIKLSFKK
jgi:isoleucyl-tRNA synthetase